VKESADYTGCDLSSGDTVGAGRGERYSEDVKNMISESVFLEIYLW
jgi:hypothetical protein